MIKGVQISKGNRKTWYGTREELEGEWLSPEQYKEQGLQPNTKGFLLYGKEKTYFVDYDTELGQAWSFYLQNEKPTTSFILEQKRIHWVEQSVLDLALLSHSTDPTEWSAEQIEEKWIKFLIKEGKKGKAERIHESVKTKLKEKYKEEDPKEIFKGAVEKGRPYVELKSIRLGGSTYRVPVEIPLKRQYGKVFKWLKEQGKGKTMVSRLSSEVLMILKGTGTVLAKRDELHKMADANREYAHYRW